jgi:uncharacterized protein
VYYEWDEQKNQANVAAHGINFSQAERFEWETAMVEIDERFDYGELRETATGFMGDIPHVMVFTQRDDAVRVISLRKATKAERRRYGQQTS